MSKLTKKEEWDQFQVVMMEMMDTISDLEERTGTGEHSSRLHKVAKQINDYSHQCQTRIFELECTVTLLETDDVDRWNISDGWKKC